MESMLYWALLYWILTVVCVTIFGFEFDITNDYKTIDVITSFKSHSDDEAAKVRTLRFFMEGSSGIREETRDKIWLRIILWNKIWLRIISWNLPRTFDRKVIFETDTTKHPAKC